MSPGGSGEKETLGYPRYDRASWSEGRKGVYRGKIRPLFACEGQRHAATIALRAAGSGIANTRNQTKPNLLQQALSLLLLFLDFPQQRCLLYVTLVLLIPDPRWARLSVSEFPVTEKH